MKPESPPAWPPRGLRPDMAAYYVGVSDSTLRRVAEAQGIKPVHITRRVVVYLREDLDRLLDRLADRPAPSHALDGREWMEG